ncbi:MAG: transcriptional regulator [Betaproteobacteria bacterium RIFCSPLOWO2_02_67_12]|nr:MAG: transcriptional regulator [Betaproteobacteria bacterium RIFCSPLOWO2_02_67_12]OGA64530.1 MAG: transcriptional regulator [Betaproteobacteria bacterium RIFCSPLOWO2_12_FULL_67_28]
MAVTSVRLSEELERKLTSAAERARRTKSWLINEAVRDYLDRMGQDERRWADTLEALASVKAGRVIAGDDMMEWIASWGKKAEKKPPR